MTATIRPWTYAKQASALSLALLACSSASGFSSMGTASVTQSNGQPCFGVGADRSNAPWRLQSLSITPAQGARSDWRESPPEVWGFDAPPPGARVDAGCVRYGDLPASARVRADAEPLKTGPVYHVEISARLEGDRDATRAYTADFCLVAGTAGSTPELRVIAWDEAAKRWRDEVCAAR